MEITYFLGHGSSGSTRAGGGNRLSSLITSGFGGTGFGGG
jgi:hypothetical protein